MEGELRAKSHHTLFYLAASAHNPIKRKAQQQIKPILFCSSSIEPNQTKPKLFFFPWREMQSKFGFHGPPLCLSGITLSHPSLSTEMADHDRRREAMRTQRSSTSAPERAHREIGIARNMGERLLEVAIRDGEIDGDLAAFVDDLCETNLTCAAKAA